MGPNKTINSISKISKAASGIKEITENYDTAIQKQATSSHHSKPSSIGDEKIIINTLLELKPCVHTPNRRHPSFPDIKRSPRCYLSIKEFHDWIDEKLDLLT